MGTPYMPLYVGDWLRDTTHLSWEEDRVYFRLVMHAWCHNGLLPLDERKIAAIVCPTTRKHKLAIKSVLEEFFVRTEHGYYNPRGYDEYCKINKLSDIRAAASRSRWNRAPNANGYANEMQTESKTDPNDSKPFHTSKDKELSTYGALSSPAKKADDDLTLESDVGKTYNPPPCPCEELVEDFHRLLPMLPRTVVLTAARRSHMASRWREVCIDGDFTSSQGRAWFCDYWARVGRSRFLTGKVASTDRSRKPFRASLQWLTLPENFAKVIEGRYDE